MTNRTILIMAAGTGGHIMPGLAIAKELVARGWKIVWMGTPTGMENQLVAEAGYPIVRVNMSGVRSKGALAWLLLPFRLLVASWQSTVAIFRVRPDVVLSMGGYVAFPGGMMAALWGKPLVVHEPGATAGLTNRALALVADRVIVGMEGAFDAPAPNAVAARLPKPKNVLWLGTPVRAEIAAIAEPNVRFRSREGRLRLFIVGGSLGAQSMNDLIVAALAGMEATGRPEVVHQSGERLFDALKASYASASVDAQVLPFIHDMDAVAGVAAILFPLPWFVADEQAGNARWLESRGAAVILDQLKTTPAQLADVLRGLTRERLADLARRARALARPEATARCADLCEELARAA